MVSEVLVVVVSGTFGVTGDDEAPPPSLLPRSVFKLLSSVPSSRRRFSLPSRAPSSAFGMASFSALTSSLMRRVSSSRRREAVFKSATSVSMSRNVTSNFSVRASSAVFKAAVSVETCSIKAKARENCSSIFCLSCSNCGGVGGAIRGEMYRLFRQKLKSLMN